jgi:isocitrate dehydrogenase
LLAEALDEANTKYLLNNKSPSRKSGELDNRGTHFYVAMYWAQALAAQDQDPALKTEFAPIAEKLSCNEEAIVSYLNEIQNQPVDLGGYYQPNDALVEAAMRPCSALNEIINAI